MGEVAGSVAWLAGAGEKEWKEWHEGFRARVEEALARDDAEALADLANEMRDCSSLIADGLPHLEAYDGESNAAYLGSRESGEQPGVAEQAEDYVALVVELRDHAVAAQRILEGADLVLDTACMKIKTEALVGGMFGALLVGAEKLDALEDAARGIARRAAELARPKSKAVGA